MTDGITEGLTVGMTVGELTLGDLYRRNARQNPEGAAIIYDGRTITFAALSERINRLANGLLGLGVGRGERVAVLSQNRPEYIEIYGAGETAGLITAAINFRLAGPEIAYIAKDSQPTAMIFEAQYAGVVGGIRADLPDVTFICLADDTGAGPDWAMPIEDLVASGGPEAPPVRAAPDDTAYLIYTSGTTGRPKGAMLTHRGQLAFAQMIAEDCGLQGSDVMLLVMPFYHVGAKVNQLACAWRGAPFVLHRSYDPAALARDIETYRVSQLHLAPLMVQELVALQRRENFDHDCIRLVQYASGPMAVANIKTALETYGSIFMQVYGMTEAGTITVLHTHQHRPDGTEVDVHRLASAGQAPMPNGIRVVRPDGTDCDVDEPGEVLCRTPALLKGYWNLPEATAETLADGWLHTGDIGALDTEDYLFILDRKKDMIVSGGENIYPREVEEALYTHPAVAEAAVIGVPDPRWGEAVLAFVVAGGEAPGEAVGEAELIEYCRTQIASYKKPREIRFVDKLPRLANQKVDKKALRAPFWEGQDRNVS